MTFEHGLSINKHKPTTRPSLMLFEESALTCHLGTHPCPIFFSANSIIPRTPLALRQLLISRNNSTVFPIQPSSVALSKHPHSGYVPKPGPASGTPSAQANQPGRTDRHCLQIKHHLHPRMWLLPLQDMLRGGRVWMRHRKPSLPWETKVQV